MDERIRTLVLFIAAVAASTAVNRLLYAKSRDLGLADGEAAVIGGIVGVVSSRLLARRHSG